ncbi:tol-like protein [Grosmannia clavigera kw1407]|uniref:Tol-like protein n=1 Tax=Grosmannia clavigera (strain kw1407 / UAMH 11150) TaxID=655863 RepID=F0XAN0_GROCL|nr:tol-like protein [Grosmannia clavigera kw1407]EFX05665.1 tol-like protein [Grosmannia clavigera kw1407]
MLKLTQGNYDEMIAGKTMHDLPKTFRDAICLCRFLKIQYLWIDSLCIIQDSVGGEDWIRESSKMAQVYQYSYCNIAATASQGPSGGCFFKRNNMAISPIEITLCVPPACDNEAQTSDLDWSTDTNSETDSGTDENHAHASPANTSPSASSSVSLGETYLFYATEMWGVGVESAPLNQRAWVLQERLLSPRQLHCSSQQLMWECHEASAAEAFPVKLPSQHPRAIETPSLKMKSLKNVLMEMDRLRAEAQRKELHLLSYCQRTVDSGHLHGRSPKVAHSSTTAPCMIYKRNNTAVNVRLIDRSRRELTRREQHGYIFARMRNAVEYRRDEVYECWYSIVGLYSSCSITYATDKLIAIDGVATIIGNALQGIDIYAFGLWVSQLPYQVLWSVRKGDDLKEPCYQVAPSWSWASVQTAVDGPMPRSSELVAETKVVANFLEMRHGEPYSGNAETGMFDPEKHAYLQIRSIFYKIRPSLPESGGGPDYVLLCPCKLDNKDNHRRAAQEGQVAKIHNQHYGISLNNTHGSVLWKSAYLAPIIATTGTSPEACGLVLVPCPNDPSTFRRIGHWTSFMFQDLARENHSVSDHSRISATDEDRFLSSLAATTEDEKCTVFII